MDNERPRRTEAAGQRGEERPRALTPTLVVAAVVVLIVVWGLIAGTNLLQG